ncbi:unnamed protein product [Brassicogethes aeneus]|uniref:F-box domain-containing protein n=1 Tax=Brassicogethes aeneus TaxID=1431903 RepID=A0A9P0FK18_BRAAE|nr:unnamed protein product [Brassicogethes aeneus]
MKKFMQKSNTALNATPKFRKLRKQSYEFNSPTSLFLFSPENKYKKFVCGLNKRSGRVQGVQKEQQRRCKSLEMMLYDVVLVGYKEEQEENPRFEVNDDVFEEYTPPAPNSITECYIDKIPDEVIINIFQNLTVADLGRCAKVSKQFRRVVWTKIFFKYNLIFDEENLDVDLAVKQISEHFKCTHYNPWQEITKFSVKDGARVSNMTLEVLAGKCPSLNCLIIRDCPFISNQGLFKIIAGSKNLVHLDVSGCKLITAAWDKYFTRHPLLKVLDLNHCTDLEDSGVKCIAMRFKNLNRLSLRGCNKITDASVDYISNFCRKLQQLSLSDCLKITDEAMWTLTRLKSTLVYLSIENLVQITDYGIRCIGKDLKLLHFNMGGCVGVSDYGVICLANGCRTLKTLSLSNTNLDDPGLCIIGDSLVSLRCLSVDNCWKITDKGVNYMVFHRRNLVKFSIKGCKLSASCFKFIKKYCANCYVEHNSVEFDIISDLMF